MKSIVMPPPSSSSVRSHFGNNSLFGDANFACTSLLYRDAKNAAYLGRTLELTIDLPYQLAFLPSVQTFSSRVGSHPVVSYTTRHPMLAVVMADRLPSSAAPICAQDLKVIEGVNAEGLTFSLLSYPAAGGGLSCIDEEQAVLCATDLGSWTLGQFASVAEVKAALISQHYTFLSNVDQSKATFGKLALSQPDSGISTASLPSSNTSVGRFVRAVFYSQFAEKVSDPDQALRTLSHIMNNFDRPKGISVASKRDGGGMEVEGLGDQNSATATEFTSWTNLTDLNRTQFYIRTYEGLNYTMFDLTKLTSNNKVKLLPLSALNGMASDGTGLLL